MLKLQKKYHVEVEDFIKNEIAPSLPKPSSVIAFHESLTQSIASRSKADPIVLILRKFAGSETGRGTITHPYSTHKNIGLVYGDNTPAIWSYVRCYKNDVGAYKKNLNNKTIPIAMILTSSEKEEHNWGTIGASELREVWGSKLKHCHILPCYDTNLDIETKVRLYLEMELGWVKQRMIRFLSPLNHFLFPGPKHFNMKIHSGGKIKKIYDIGESPEFIAWMRWYYYTVHMSEHREFVEKALSEMGGQDSFPLTKPKSFHIQLTAKPKQKGKVAEDVSTIGQCLNPELIEHIEDVSHIPNRVNSDVCLNEESSGMNSQYITHPPYKVFTWRLSFRKSAQTQKVYIGTYEINLEYMAKLGCVRKEREGYRLKVFHDADGFYIRANSSDFRIKIAPPFLDSEAFLDTDSDVIDVTLATFQMPGL